MITYQLLKLQMLNNKVLNKDHCFHIEFKANKALNISVSRILRVELIQRYVNQRPNHSKNFLNNRLNLNVLCKVNTQVVKMKKSKSQINNNKNNNNLSLNVKEQHDIINKKIQMKRNKWPTQSNVLDAIRKVIQLNIVWSKNKRFNVISVQDSTIIQFAILAHVLNVASQVIFHR